MNIGERHEIIFKLIITYKRDNNEKLFNQDIKSVGFMGNEFSKLPTSFNIEQLKYMSDDKLRLLAYTVGIQKAPTNAKADIEINGEGVSLKSLAGAPPAIVNHTSRPGFEFACANAGISIDTLDYIINDYWEKRLNGTISEDVANCDDDCPFISYQEYMRPILEYFLFHGTGSRLSSLPADYLIEFVDPFDEHTYKKLTKAEAVDAIWPKLKFSLRAKKGMPANYDPNTYKGKNSTSIAKWVRYKDNHYRGALHIRESKK